MPDNSEARGVNLPDYSDTAAAMALAGGVITLEMVEALRNKGVLTEDEIRKILSRALSFLVPFLGTPNGAGAMRFISSLIETRFPPRS